MPVSFARFCLVALTFALACTANAARPGDTPADYSHTLPLSVGGHQAVVPLRLPRAVYLTARSPQLHDLRVFDATGAPMPFALVDLAPPPTVTRPTAPTAIFPLYGSVREADRLHDSLQIRTGTDGAVISVTAPARTVSDELVSLILDLRPAALAANIGAAAPVSALALSLPAGTGTYSAHVALDVSNDLQDWETQAEAAVSWLVNERGASVGKHRIEFAPRSFRYARIRWLEGKPVAFANIDAEYLVQQQVARHLDTIVLPGVPAGEGRDLAYKTPVAIPALSLGFVFQGQNVVMPALVGQYEAVRSRKQGGRTEMQLQPLVNTTFYQLFQKGQQRVSGDLEIPETHAATWIVRPLTDIPERPALRLRWRPATVVFVAGGTAPYRLAYGRTGARAASVPLSQVAPAFTSQELAGLDMATAGEPVQQLVSTGSAGVNAESAPDQKRRWLWGLLVGGLAVLGAMAWHLFRQLKAEVASPHVPEPADEH